MNHSAQVAGLLLCLAGTLWLVWVDVYLMHEFPAHYRSGALMTSGPYRRVRHPRYLGLLATRLALPLVFCSIIACAIALAWALLIRRRARLEERYLTLKFGEAYANYAVHTLGIP
ncbi:MAG: isoprenylcysteine carboxylmethyltransferase family protein [Acidobacteriaceae bacterium]|nr:isoprenylcysteine carboxylmethyltransferase family protein [Acidobacteriaceae bacterium]